MNANEIRSYLLKIEVIMMWRTDTIIKYHKDHFFGCQRCIE